MRVFEEDAATDGSRNTSNDLLRGIHLNQRILVLTLCGHANDLREEKYGKGQRLGQTALDADDKLLTIESLRFWAPSPLARRRPIDVTAAEAVFWEDWIGVTSARPAHHRS